MNPLRQGLDTILSGPSCAFHLFKRSLYDFGLKKSLSPHQPVLCVGNLVFGGSGKTPVTIHLASVLQELGFQVVISASGYGAPHSKGATLAPEGDLKAAEWGDEPALIRWLAPSVPLIVGRARVQAAEICHREFPGAVLLMDDGFQHMRLKKDVVVLVDPGPGSGPVREMRETLRRADLVLPRDFEIVPHFEGLIDPKNPEDIGVNLKEVDLVLGIARPQRVAESLRAQGIRVRKMRVLQDHDPMTEPGLFEGTGQRPIAVTAKDWVKIKDRDDVAVRQIRVIGYSVSIEPADRFREWLAGTLAPFR